MFKRILIVLMLFCLSRDVFPAETVDISFWQFLVPERKMREILDDFESKYPRIKVKMQQLNWRDGLDKITTSIAAGITSDVCELGSTWITRFADYDALNDMSPYMENIESEFPDDVLKSVNWKNKYYAVPWVSGTRVLYYNKSIFAKVGLDPSTPPVTWDDLKHYILKIKLKCPDLYPFALPVGENYTPWQTFLPFIWGAGGSIFDSEDPSKVVVDSEKNIETLTFYQFISRYSLLAKQAHIDRNFAMGKIAMMISGGWNLGLIPKLNPQLKYGVAVTPKCKDKSVSFVGGEVLVVFKHSKHPRESKLLIDYLTSSEVYSKIITDTSSFVPSRRMADVNKSLERSPLRKVFFKQLNTARSPNPNVKWAHIQEELSWGIEEALFYKASPKTVLTKLKKKIEDIVYEDNSLKGTMYSKFIGYILFFTVLALFLVLIAYNVLGKKTCGVISKKNIFHLYVFLIPWLIIFFIFYLFPFIYSFVLSFTNYSLLKGYYSFCGIDNYLEVLSDPEFRKAFFHTFYFAIGTCPVSLGLALFCAVIIYRQVPFYRIFQAGLFAPISISVIVAASIFSYFFSDTGIFNSILDFLHIPRPFPDNWLVNPKLALISVMIMNVWSSFGLYMIIFIAGLHSIPRELLEAGRVDGASSLQRFFYIALPQLKPFILLVIVLNTIKVFQIFPEIFTMTQGGPHGATLTLVYYLYKVGFQQFSMGKASAVGYILLVIISVFSMIELYLLRRSDRVEK